MFENDDEKLDTVLFKDTVSILVCITDSGGPTIQAFALSRTLFLLSHRQYVTI